MPLDGISSPTNHLHNNPIAEAGSLAGLEEKIEKDTVIKRTDESTESQINRNDKDKDGSNLAAGYYTEEDKKKAEKVSAKKPIRYSFKFNGMTEMVELIDVSSSKTVETINPKDFLKLVTELHYNSGMFIDNSA